MPEYGIADKGPERIAEEQAEAQFLKDSTDVFKRAELQEIEDRHRRANAEQEKLESQKIQAKELKELRQNLDSYVAEYTAYKAAEAHRTKVAERKASIKGVIATFIVTVLAGIILYYWPSIMTFFFKMFQ